MGVIYRQKTDHVIFARFLLNFFLGFVQNYFCWVSLCELRERNSELQKDKTHVIANCEKARGNSESIFESNRNDFQVLSRFIFCWNDR